MVIVLGMIEKNDLNIVSLTFKDDFCDKGLEYVKGCGWKAGTSLGKKIRNCEFEDYERVFILKHSNNIIGYCTFTKKDGIDVNYEPFIGYVFIDEEYRGQRLSEKLIKHCEGYALELGFGDVYIISDHEGLYEKFGYDYFEKGIDKKGREEKIFRKKL